MKDQSTKIYSTAVLAVILLLVAFFTYFNSLDGKFIADDETLIVNNTQFLSHLENIPKSFRIHYKVNQPNELAFFRPVVLCSYIVDYQLFGLNPRGFHFRNTMLHAINCLLIFWLLILLTRKKLLAFFTALLFAVHPIHVNAVAWISGRPELFSTLFSLLTLILLLLHVQKKKQIWFIISFVTFYLALLSRATAAFTVAIIPLVLIAKEKLDRDFQIEPLIILRYFLTYAVVLAFYILHRYVVLGPLSSLRVVDGLPFFSRLGNSFTLGLYYIGKIILPLKFEFYPSLNLTGRFFTFSNIAGIPVFLVLAALTFYFYNRKHLISFSILLFLLSILPIVNIIPVDLGCKECVLYFPSLAFCLVLGIILHGLIQSKTTWLKYTVFVIVIIAMAASVLVTNKRTQLFTSGLKFWEYMVEEYPRLATARNTLGAIYLERGNLDDAREEFQKAIRLDPRNWASYYNMGLLYAEEKELGKTIYYWERTRELYTDLKLLEDLGLTYFTIKDFNKAIEVWEDALKIDPHNSMIEYYIRTTHELIEYEDSIRAANQDSG